MKRFALFLACLSIAAGASAQALLSEPVTIVDGRVVTGGDMAVSVAREDPGGFSFSDCELSTMSDIRLSVTASVRAADRILRRPSSSTSRASCGGSATSHSHMSAFILVFGHPYFATTDADGRYRIDDIPTGTYTGLAWHEGQTSDSRSVVIPAQGGIVEQGFEGQ